LAPTVVYEDNQGTLGMIAMEFLGRRTRGIIIEMSYAREALRRGVICPYFCKSQQQMVDELTKVLGRVLFTQHLLPLLDRVTLCPSGQHADFEGLGPGFDPREVHGLYNYLRDTRADYRLRLVE
jgi:hypothetical protein